MKANRLLLKISIICMVLIFASLTLLTACGKEETVTTTTIATATATATSVTTTTSTTTTAVKPIEIRIAGGMPPGHPVSDSILGWKQKLEAATNGLVTVTFYEGGTMGKSQELYDLAQQGVVEAVHTAEFWAGGRFPIVQGLNNLPFNMQDIGDIKAVDDALFKAGLLAELEPFKLLYFTPAALLCFFTKDKINSLADFSKMSIRSSGTAAIALELMGATPVNMPGEEEYMALQTGTLNGNLTGADNADSRKLYEVLNYGCKNPFAAGGFLFIMNKDFWNSLPADIQATIDKINAEQAEAHLVSQAAAIENSWKNLQQYIEIYSVSSEEIAKWKAICEPVADDWIADMESKGLPGQKAYDTMQQVLKQRHG